ncbi:MAG: helix-turn-helix domain-containing protein [Candidatus Binataceae bacterium]
MKTNTSDFDAIERQSPARRRRLRQEQLIVDVTEALAAALEEAKMTKSQLAERMGKSKGFVSQVLAGGRNLTLRTVSDVADALNREPRLNLNDRSAVRSAPRSAPRAYHRPGSLRRRESATAG